MKENNTTHSTYEAAIQHGNTNINEWDINKCRQYLNALYNINCTLRIT